MPLWTLKVNFDVNKFTSRSANKYRFSKANCPITKLHFNRTTILADSEAMWVYAFKKLSFLTAIAVSYLIALISKRSP